MADERVRELLDFSLYLDITDDVKFAWKIQRDMVERGHSLESIQQSIEARKPDFDAFVAPQREFADVVLQVLPTDLIPDEKEGKVNCSVTGCFFVQFSPGNEKKPDHVTLFRSSRSR